MDYTKLKAEILAELRQEFYLVPKSSKTAPQPIRFSVKWSNGIDMSELHVYESPNPPVLVPVQVPVPEPIQVPVPVPIQVPEQFPEDTESDESDDSYESENDSDEPEDPEPITKYKYTHSSNYSAMVDNPEMLAIFEKWYESNKSKYNALKHAFNSLIKHEGYIEISSDGLIRTNKGLKK